MEKFRHTRVLLTDGHARQVLPMAKAFKKLGCRVTTLNRSKLDIGYASRYPDEKVLDPEAGNAYRARFDAIRRLVESGRYDVVVPTTDLSAAILSRHKPAFSRHARVAACDWETFRLAADKLNTMRVCTENNIPCTRTFFNLSSARDIAESDLEYPLVIKPRSGYGAIGFRRVDSQRAFLEMIARQRLDLADSVVQEYVPQSALQYELAAYVDGHNELKTCLLFSKNRWYPVNGGSSTLNITVDDRAIKRDCARLLKLINWRGCADIDLIRDPRTGMAKVLEINPRVSGSVKICFEAGVDLARQIIETALDREVTDYRRYRVGVRLRSMHTDFLWFIQSRRRFRAKPSWLSSLATTDQVVSLGDPLPAVTYTLQAFMKYRQEMNLRRPTRRNGSLAAMPGGRPAPC